MTLERCFRQFFRFLLASFFGSCFGTRGRRRRRSGKSLWWILIVCVLVFFFSEKNHEPTDSGTGKDPSVSTSSDSRYASEKTLTGRVIRVTDGDTVTILTEEKEEIRIRFQGIDAPERSQDFGKRSREMLNSLVYGKTIRVEVDKIDKYGRVVGRIWLDDPFTQTSADIEETMLREGMAWHYSYFNHEKKLSDAQAQAQAARRGLWSQPNPEAPWEWRRKQRK